MGWLSNLTSSLFQGIKTVGKGIVEAAPPVVKIAVAAAHRLLQAIEDAVKGGVRPPPQNVREQIESDLFNVNEQIQALRKRYLDRGSLSASDQREWVRLRDRRKDLMADLEAIDRVDQASDIVGDADTFEAIRVSDGLAHILQYHVGQHTSNKACRVCGLPLVLQWKRGITVASTGSFFWGCTGYYMPIQCTQTEALTPTDLQLFTNTDRSEFKLTPQELADYAQLKNPKRVIGALRSIKGTTQGVAGYRCPIHGETLLLRENKGTRSNLLDQFFLGCPRWLPEEKQGCNFLVKIKSAAQLSAVLEAGGEDGLIATVDSTSVSGKPTRNKNRWLPADDEFLAREFDAGATVKQLAVSVQRTERAVEIRLVFLGKNPPSTVYSSRMMVD